MDAIIKTAVVAALVMAATWPLANQASATPRSEAGIQRSTPIASFLISDEDMQYGD